MSRNGPAWPSCKRESIRAAEEQTPESNRHGSSPASTAYLFYGLGQVSHLLCADESNTRLLVLLAGIKFEFISVQTSAWNMIVL